MPCILEGEVERSLGPRILGPALANIRKTPKLEFWKTYIYHNNLDSYQLRTDLSIEISSGFLLFVIVVVLFFETGILFVALVVLVLALQTRLASNSEIHLLLPHKC